MTTTHPAVVPADEIRIPGSRTLRYEGAPYGSDVSFFLVTNDPDEGPGLHRHPYTETWTVLEGEATVTLGDEQIVVRAGDTATVRPGVWHGFVNSGAGVLRIVCIHASPVMIQEEYVGTEAAR